MADDRKPQLPKVFIGSSSEQKAKDIAEAVREHLNGSGSCEATVWTDGVFRLGRGNLENLNQLLNQFDFAVMVLAPDDFVETHKGGGPAPRDNVVFELGLFMGRLGTKRTFYITDKEDKVKIPTDFAGVTEALFQSRGDGNLLAATASASQQIVRQIRELGIVEKQSALNKFTENIQTGFKLEDPLFQEEIRFLFRDWYAEAEEWTKGTVRVNENYSDMLLRVYERAKRSIFSTSVPSYRKIWRGDLGTRILQNQSGNKNAKSTRVFLFDMQEDIQDQDYEIFEKHLKHGIEVLVFIDSNEKHFNFPPDMGNDFTMIDEGEVIGVTRNVGSEETWYFNDERRKEIFRRLEGTLRRLSHKYLPGHKYAFGDKRPRGATASTADTASA